MLIKAAWHHRGGGGDRSTASRPYTTGRLTFRLDGIWRGMIGLQLVWETGVGWDKFWLRQCPSAPNESPDGETNDVFGEHVTTAFTGATCIIDVRFASVISPKITF